jgi:hypothetical protein
MSDKVGIHKQAIKAAKEALLLRFPSADDIFLQKIDPPHIMYSFVLDGNKELFIYQDPNYNSAEQQFIDFEAQRNKAEDDFFEARPSLERNIENRFVFDGGFRMAWDYLKRLEALAELSKQAQENCEYD